MNGLPQGSLLTRMASLFHRRLARHRGVYHAHLYLWSCVARLLPHPLRTHLAWHLQRHAPLGLRFPARTVQLGDPPVSARWIPHSGMLDQHFLIRPDWVYEGPVTRLLHRLLPGKHLVVEVGANVGLHTIYMAKTLEQLSGDRLLVSFEPSHRALSALLDNVLANDLRNVAISSAAVFESAGVSRLIEMIEPHKSTCNTLIPGFSGDRPSALRRDQPVLLHDVVSLDAVFSTAQGKGILLKLDAEGADLQVLRALEPLLRKYRPDLVVEVLPHEEAEWNAAMFLTEIYELFHLTDRAPAAKVRFEADVMQLNRDYWLRPRPV